MIIWSIIMPARNEEQYIGSCLDSLCEMNYPHEAFEVIVVDNGSTDRTAPIGQSYQGRLNIRVVSMPTLTVGALRNAGATVSTGKRLAFLDSDCFVVPSWLHDASCALDESPNSVLGAFYKVPEQAGWPARMWHSYIGNRRRGRVNYVPASNILLEKKLFSDLGGFDTQLHSNEDSHFCAKARAHGAQIVALPELAVTHLGAEKTIADFIRRQFWHGSSVLNRAALGNNIRAIGIAVSTLFCLVWLLIAASVGKGIVLPGILVIAPAVFLTMRSAAVRGNMRDIPGLLLLLCAYSVARALAFPVALFNCAYLKSLKAPTE